MKPKTVYSRIVYNAWYGGYSVSDYAARLYGERYLEKWKKASNGPSRTDPIFVDVVLELGEKASGQYANLQVQYFNSKYEDFVHCDEYDGLESVVVDVEAYNLHHIEQIARNTELSAEDIVEKIRAILDDPHADSGVHDKLPKGGVIARDV